MDISERGQCRICNGRLGIGTVKDLCSRCSRTDGSGKPPLSVPPLFWEDPAIRQALSERHMGKVIAAYRANPAHRSRVRQTDVARWAGCTQPRLSHIENGPPLQTLDQLCFWARLLGVPQSLLWFHLPDRSGIEPAAVSPIRGGAGSGFRLLRIGDTGKGHDPDVAAMHAFRSCDSELGGGHLYREVVTYLTSDIGPRLFGGSEETSREVFTAAAGLTEMAGWMAHDGGNDQQAYQHFSRARDLAKIGGDRQLLAHVYASMSHLALHQVQPREAMRHAYEGEMALRKAPGNPELAARLWSMQARGFAALGQRREALKLLDRAASTLTCTDTSWTSPWVSRFDEGSLSSEAARCWRQLGDLRRARVHVEQILDVRPPKRARSRAFAQLTLATILAQEGNPDQAHAVGSAVLDSTKLVASSVVIRHMGELHQRLQPYRHTSAIAEFLDRLGTDIRDRTRAQPWSSTGVRQQ
ncbi:helix-turn-helix domain-containing protein [Nocardia sp. NPDC052001]|uniref:helix-turn-helix domain-containing protein n=1 Tax=Nocardia sp. NPDC052001 TaxID=3154853 RepID=UPI0034415569